LKAIKSAFYGGQENFMRLVRFEDKTGTTHFGALTDVGVLDFESALKTLGSQNEYLKNVNAFLTAGDSAIQQAQQLIKAAPASAFTPPASVKLRAPIAKAGKIIAVGLNYKDHSIESGAKEPPKTPMIFAKFPTSLCGPEDAIVIPAGDPQVDYEAEMGVVIGRTAKGVSASNALKYVGGYLPLNDVSARAWQFADKQWVRGKSCDTFCPIGPYLTTSDEIPDPHVLSIAARVNGTTLQDSNTSKMIFKIPELIEFISASITLEPGDIIATGTPEGVGVFRTPPIFLKPGDVIEIDIEKLGVLKNLVVAAKN
jgi:2-keto-4-pentenoate hydratase/2-oxohepta-3-ene-1,7-dioic acid hydratase in catechol pathway